MNTHLQFSVSLLLLLLLLLLFGIPNILTGFIIGRHNCTTYYIILHRKNIQNLPLEKY